MTSVNATYALVTFVHMCNISALIDPILTKLFGPNILGALNLFGPNLKYGPNLLWTRFFGPKKFLFSTLFLTKHFSY